MTFAAESWAFRDGVPPPPHPCAGLPQLVGTTDELLPIILGVRELAARQCIVCSSPQKPADRLREALRRVDVEVLNPEGSFVLSQFDAGHNAGVGADVAAFARRAGLPGLLWNYTPGTKPMFFGLYKGLRVGGEASVVRDMFYLDTSEPLPLWFAGEPAPRPLAVRLGVPDILAANGFRVDGAVRVTRPFDPGSLPREMERNMRTWIRDAVGRGRAELVGTVEAISAGPGDWLTFHVADALVRSGRAGEVWCGVKVAPFPSTAPDGREQDLDLAVAADNTLVVCECKWVDKPKGEDVLKLAPIARKVGGRKACPVYVARQPDSGAAADQTGTGRKGEQHDVGVVYWREDDVASSLAGLDAAVRSRLARRPAGGPVPPSGAGNGVAGAVGA